MHSHCSFLRLAGLFIAISGLLFGRAESRAQEITELVGHSSDVYTLEFTPDGKWLVTGAFDNTLRLWDLATGKSVKVMSGHTGLVLTVAISKDGKKIASGSTDNTIKTWEIPNSEPLANLTGHTGAVTALSTNADGTQLLTGGEDKLLKLWNRADGQLLRDIPGSTAVITRVAVRNDGVQLVAGDQTGVVRLFNPADGAPLGVIGAHAGEITGLRYAGNQTYLLTAGADGLVKRWPLDIPAAKPFPGHTAAVTAFRLSPDGTKGVSASADKTVRIWSVAEAKELLQLAGHTEAVSTVVFSPNGAQIATGGLDKIARLYDAASGAVVKEFSVQATPITQLAISADGQQLVIGDAGASLKIYKTADATEQVALAGHAGAINGLTFSPDGAQILSTSADDQNVRIWTAADGAAARTIDAGAKIASLGLLADGTQLAVAVTGEANSVRLFNVADGADLGTLAGFPAVVTASSFSADKTKLATSCTDGVVRVFDLATKKQLQHYVHHQGASHAVSFLPDHKTLISAGDDATIVQETVSVQMFHVADEGRVNDLAVQLNANQHATAGADGGVKLWNSDNGAPVRAYAGHQGPVLAVTIDNAAQQIASTGSDKLLMLWKFDNAQAQRRVELPAEANRISYSDDGKKLVVATAENTVLAFDPTPPNPQPAEPPGLEPSQTLAGHTAAITALKFAPDNSTLVTSSADGSTKSWSVAAAGFVANFTGHSSQIYSVVFNADGTQLISASNDKTVRLWSLTENKELKTITTQPAGVYSVVLSSDEKELILGTADNAARAINIESGAEVRRYQGPDQPVYTVAISPDGQTVAAGGVGLGGPRKVFLWNIAGDQPQKILEGHKDDIYRVVFNPSGNRLLSIGYAGNINIWDPAAGTPVFQHRLPIISYSATYAPEGDRIAIASHDGKVYLLTLPAEAR
ncbi:MAG: hypothetical protein O3A29_20915 [Planctomycetota bacterium]|nr:hypothetical protein [Planctomycetota bacterium]